MDHHGLNEVASLNCAAVPDVLIFQSELESKTPKWYATLMPFFFFFPSLWYQSAVHSWLSLGGVGARWTSSDPYVCDQQNIISPPTRS